MDRCEIKEQETQEIIKKRLDLKIIRINPDKKNFNIFDKIGKIQSFISKSNKDYLKNQLKSLQLVMQKN